MTKFLLVLALTACATAPTRRGIALDFRDCFEEFTPGQIRLGSGPPLSVRCQCLEDADRRCLRAGFAAGCWRDDFDDTNHLGCWAVAACDERERRGL